MFTGHVDKGTRMGMQGLLLMFLLSPGACLTAQGQGRTPRAEVAHISEAAETRVSTNEKGELQVQLSPGDVQAWKARGFVHYGDLGAKGDGKADDMDAIAAAHAVANQHGLSVKADAEATYYIGGGDRTAVIQTNTDFGAVAFVIDDTDVQDRNAHVFLVRSSLESFELEGVASLKRNQEKLEVTLPGACLVWAIDSNVKRYIRMGANQNQGAPQTDVFIVDKDGRVDMKAPIIWDFDQITSVTAHPIDPGPLTITGGRFTTIANQAESKYTYYM